MLSTLSMLSMLSTLSTLFILSIAILSNYVIPCHPICSMDLTSIVNSNTVSYMYVEDSKRGEKSAEGILSRVLLNVINGIIDNERMAMRPVPLNKWLKDSVINGIIDNERMAMRPVPLNKRLKDSVIINQGKETSLCTDSHLSKPASSLSANPLQTLAHHPRMDLVIESPRALVGDIDIQ